MISLGFLLERDQHLLSRAILDVLVPEVVVVDDVKPVRASSAAAATTLLRFLGQQVGRFGNLLHEVLDHQGVGVRHGGHERHRAHED